MKIRKKNHFASIMMLLALLGITPTAFAKTASDAASMEEVKKNTKDLIKTLKSYTADQRDEAVEKTKTALDRLDKRIDTLEKQIDQDWDKMSKTTREKTRATLKALRKQRNEVAEWTGRLKNSSADAWDQMKKGFSDAYDTFHTTWEKTEKEFGAKK